MFHSLPATLRKWGIFLSDYIRKPLIRRSLYGVVAALSTIFIGRAISANWDTLTQRIWRLNWHFIALSVLLYPIGMLPTAVAWHTLLQSLDVTLPFSYNLRVYALSILPRHIPGGIWYVSSRTMLYQDVDISGTRIFVSTGLESILLSVTGAITSLVWFSLSPTLDSHFLPLQVAALVAGAGIVVFMLWTSKINHLLYRIQHRWHITQPLQIHRKKFIITLLWMFAAWTGGGIILFVLNTAFSPPDWKLLPSMIGIWGGAGAISLSLGALIQGMGLREITLSALLSTTMPLLDATIIAIAFRLVLTTGEALWIPIFVWATRSLKKTEDIKKHQESASK